MQKEGNLSAAYKFFTDLIDEDMVESKVKYFANSVIDGKYYKYEKDIKEYTNYLVRRTAHDAMVRNAKNNGLYYALVPTGTETCAFCFMLASRGFVYSEKTQEK